MSLLAKNILLIRHNYKAYFTLVHNFKYRPSELPHVDFICNLLNRIADGEAINAIVVLPPRHLKTTTITETFPSYYLGRNPENSVITISYSDDSAKKFGIRNRNKFERFAYDIWGLEVSKERAENKYWEIKDHLGKMISSGVGGQITGEGANLLIIDDPIKNRSEAYSKVFRDKLYYEYTNTMETRLHPGASKIIILTRWHEDDLVGRILKTEKNWEVYLIPAIAQENDILGRKPGEAICPKWMDVKDFEAKKAVLGLIDFNALYMGGPTKEGGNTFKTEWNHYFKEDDNHYLLDDGRSFLKNDCWILQTNDPAASESQSADYFVLMTMVITPDKDILIKDIFRERIGADKYESTFEKYYFMYEPLQIGVENKTFGLTILQQLKKHYPLRACIADQDKYTRSMTAQARYSMGKVFHKISNEGKKPEFIETYEAELKSFPSGEHDDQVDCISYGAIMVMGKREVKIY